MKDIYKDPTVTLSSYKIYLICILIRISLGIAIINNIIHPKYLTIIGLMVVILFTPKYFKLPNVWKNYLRTIIVYGLLALGTISNGNAYNKQLGTLVIADALMGLQTRHIFNKI